MGYTIKKKQRKGNIVSFIDNCPSHPSDLLISNVKVQFLLASATSHLQLLGQRIIEAFKLHYRKFLFKAIISKVEECKSANKIASCINALVTIIWINDSWNLA